MSHNIIGGNGLLVNNYFAGMTVQGNTIEGAKVGILAEGVPFATDTTIKNNIVFNNTTGISLGFEFVGAGAVITSNSSHNSRNTPQ